MRTRSLLLWILIVAAIAFAAHRSGQFGTRNPGAPLSGPARVVDGDSLEIGGQRIRLYGIDAPEGRQHCRDAQGQDYACGREAARALDTLSAGAALPARRSITTATSARSPPARSTAAISARRWCARATRATTRATAMAATRPPSVRRARHGAACGRGSSRTRASGGSGRCRTAGVDACCGSNNLYLQIKL